MARAVSGKQLYLHHVAGAARPLRTGRRPTFDVTFALQRATRHPRKGVFVTITGGPGTRGISVAEGYTDALDPRIPAQYDIVFIDQRGVGLSRPLQCPNASLEWYTRDTIADPVRCAGGRLCGRCRRYANRCVAETGVNPNLLRYFSTRQAVEDLEAIRRWLRADRFDLYGESYGTQYVQTYAAAHPHRVHALFVDGPVDLTLNGTEYYAAGVRAFDATLRDDAERVLADAGLPPRSGGRRRAGGLRPPAARLARGPRQLRLRAMRPARYYGERSSLGDLETAAAGYVYSNTDQMHLQRAMAWASRGELLPLARLLYVSLGQDPETLEAIVDLSYSDAMYYAVECMDYAYGSGTAAARASRIPGGGQDGWRGIGSTRQHLLRGPAVRLLACASGERGPARRT